MRMRFISALPLSVTWTRPAPRWPPTSIAASSSCIFCMHARMNFLRLLHHAHEVAHRSFSSCLCGWRVSRRAIVVCVGVGFVRRTQRSDGRDVGAGEGGEHGANGRMLAQFREFARLLFAAHFAYRAFTRFAGQRHDPALTGPAAEFVGEFIGEVRRRTRQGEDFEATRLEAHEAHLVFEQEFQTRIAAAPTRLKTSANERGIGKRGATAVGSSTGSATRCRVVRLDKIGRRRVLALVQGPAGRFPARRGRASVRRASRGTGRSPPSRRMASSGVGRSATWASRITTISEAARAFGARFVSSATLQQHLPGACEQRHRELAASAPARWRSSRASPRRRDRRPPPWPA